MWAPPSLLVLTFFPAMPRPGRRQNFLIGSRLFLAPKWNTRVSAILRSRDYDLDSPVPMTSGSSGALSRSSEMG